MKSCYYDKTGRRLVYITESATPEFWDHHWEKQVKETYFSPPAHRTTVWITKKYLPVGATILEGGCGMGDKVYALHKAGFKAKGIDYAQTTVEMIKQHWPHLDISLGDVRELPFPSESFDGYWSLGVIEHFIDGYNEIAKEIARVLRPGGYLFLTFPMMNPIRRMRAESGAYQTLEINDDSLSQNFYQYALDPDSVIEEFTSLGFTVVQRGGLSSFDCLAEETRWFKPVDALLHLLPFGLRTKLGVIADMALGRYFGHVALLVLRRNEAC